MEQATQPTKKKIDRKKVLIGAGAVLLALLGGCVYTTMTAKPTVLATTASYGEIVSTLSSKAIVSNNSVEEYVVPETTEVAKVHFDIGDTVRKGDPIVEYDNSAALNSYKRAAIAYEQARLSLAEIERKYFDLKEDLDDTNRDIDFFREKWEEYEDSNDPADMQWYNTYYSRWQTAKQKKESLEDAIPSADVVKSNQLSFELAKMALDEAEDMKNNLPANVVATGDGVIQHIGVYDYAPAPKGTVAVAVRTTATDTIDFTVGRYDIAKVKLDQPATVTISGRDYTGKVSHIDPVAGADGTLRAKVKLDDPEGIVPGVSADLEIETYRAENVLSLPIEAVKTDRTGDYCYVLTDNGDGTYAPVKTFVTIGQSSALSIEVIDGISEGQLVVSNPPQGIETMTKVNVLPQN